MSDTNTDAMGAAGPGRPSHKHSDNENVPLDNAGEPIEAGHAEAGGGPAGDGAPEGTPRPEEEIARLESEKSDLTDRLLRVVADMDNLRRRTEREMADARKYAVAKFAGDMLVVGDNLRRALEAVPAEQRESGDDTFKALIEGVEMTGREMDRLLEKNGVSRIEAMGQRFDPNRHQAMFEAPDPNVPAGTVVQVVQEGYAIGDRVLRAALVGVSRGGTAAREESSGTAAQ